MGEHSYVTYFMHDSSKTEIPFDILSFPDYAALTTAADSVEKAHGTTDFSRREPIYDRNTITAEFLISQIDYAFRAWREKPWLRNALGGFPRLCSSYRGSNEPLESCGSTSGISMLTSSQK